MLLRPAPTRTRTPATALALTPRGRPPRRASSRAAAAPALQPTPAPPRTLAPPPRATAQDDAIDVDDRIPVTIITGFLGAGKTTLLNRLLRDDHGERLAVIENEFGEASVDTDLVAAAAPAGLPADAIVTLANGCLCCTVRGDLIDAVVALAGRRGEFDRIVIETTGLASPKPIIETFVLADPVARCARLDGVVTLVDAAHAMRHLGEVPARTADPSEAVAQVAYADRIILNKTDLVDAAALASLEARVRAINGVAPIVRTQRAAVAVDAVLGVGGFDLDRVAADLEAGAGADGCGDPGHGEPGHVCGGEAGHDHHAHDHAHAHNPAHGEEGHVCGGGACGDDGAHAHSHSHDHAPASPAAPLHDDAVSSVTVSLAGDLDLELVNMWLGALVDVRSEDLYRYKGVLSIAGFPRRYVFQGVHALFTGEAGAPWGEGEARTSRMVFIGRELDAELLREGFGECVVESDGVPKGRKKGAGAGAGAV